jgi:UDP-glucose 4-epimerase
MRVLVTGGSGFIGSHVVDRLTAAGVEAKIFDLRNSPHHAARQVQTHVGDLLDREALRQAMRGCDAVAHLGAMADADMVARQPCEAERVNSRGTLNVLEAAREAGVKRVIYASTIWVYSDADGEEVDEETALGLPGHLYTATKLAGEMYCRSYAELYGLECTILRFGIPYGPRARPEAVVPTFVRKALAGEPLTIAGGGRQSRRFVYVEDLAEGVVRALAPEAANRVYNLVGDEDVTIAQVARTVQRTCGDVPVVDTPARGADFAGVRVSGERADRELGWRASTPFATGLERYVDWHRAQGVPAPRRDFPPVVGPVGAVARRALPLGLLFSVVLMLAGFLEVLHRAGSGGDDLRTITMTSLVGLTIYLLLTREDGLGGLALLSAGVFALAVLRWPHDMMRLAHSDVDLIVQSTLGSAFGVATGVTSRWVMAARLRERPSDTSG